MRSKKAINPSPAGSKLHAWHAKADDRQDARRLLLIFQSCYLTLTRRHRILSLSVSRPQANKADTIFHFSPLAMLEQANQTDPDAPQLVGEWRRAWSRVMRMASEFHRPGGAAPLFRDACARTYDRSRTGPGGVPKPPRARGNGHRQKCPPLAARQFTSPFPRRIALIGAGRERRSGQRDARHVRARKAPERARPLWYGGRQRGADSRTLTEPWPLSARRPAQVGQTPSRLSPTCARASV